MAASDDPWLIANRIGQRLLTALDEELLDLRANYGRIDSLQILGGLIQVMLNFLESSPTADRPYVVKAFEALSYVVLEHMIAQQEEAEPDTRPIAAWPRQVWPPPEPGA